jgi:hypothetical protein
MSLSSSALNNDPTFSSLELIGGLSSPTLNWNEKSDLKISGGLLIRDNIIATGNIQVNKLNVNEKTIIYGTLDGIAGNLVLIGDITPTDANVSGNICWESLTVFGNVNVTGKTTYYNDDVQLALMENCLIDNNHDTQLCANEDDTVSWLIGSLIAATLTPNGAFKFALASDASGDLSFAEGVNTSASGMYSHVEGNLNATTNTASHVLGYNSTVSGYACHIEGRQHSVSGWGNHVEGSGTTVSGNINSIYVTGSGTFSGDQCHAEALGIVYVNSDLSHIESVCKVNSDLGLDHLESHFSGDLQSVTIGDSTATTGLCHSDASQEETYLVGYNCHLSLGVRSMVKGSFGSCIGPDCCVNQYGMCTISPGTVDSYPFGIMGGSTFVNPESASVGHGHGQLSLFHIRGVTSDGMEGNLSLMYPIIPEVFPELKYKGGDATVTNTDPLRQIWNVNLTVVGKDTVSSGCFGQTLNFVAVHNASGTNIQVANISKGAELSMGTLSGSVISVLAKDNTIRIAANPASINETHWSATMKVINSGVMDFMGEYINELI